MTLRAIIKWFLDRIIFNEEWYRSQYQTDVVDCHPFNSVPPMSYEEWRKT